MGVGTQVVSSEAPVSSTSDAQANSCQILIDGGDIAKDDNVAMAANSEAPGSRAVAAGSAAEEVPQPLRELAAWVRTDIAKRGSLPAGNDVASEGGSGAGSAVVPPLSCGAGMAAAGPADIGAGFIAAATQPSCVLREQQRTPAAPSTSTGGGGGGPNGGCMGSRDGKAVAKWTTAMVGPSTVPFVPPNPERLDKCAEEWLRRLGEAMPAVREAVAKARAEAEASAVAAKIAAEMQEKRRLRLFEGPNACSLPLTPVGTMGGGSIASASPGAASLAGSLGSAVGSSQKLPERSRPGSPPAFGYQTDAPAPEGGPSGLGHPEVTSQTCNFAAARGASNASAASIGTVGSPPTIISGVSSLLTGFDRLFSENRLAEPNSPQPPGPIKFRVQVPMQYPGVQFRKSKNLNDRYLKYAKNGTIIRGFVEEDGEWIRLADAIYLPMRVNGVQILEAMDENGKNGKGFWFACGQGGMEEEEEVLSNLDEIK